MAVPVIGIDLGTTNSAVAFVDTNGQARAIPNAEGALTTPSIVLWNEQTFLVGQAALRAVQRAQDGERTHLTGGLIRGVKRMMGDPPRSGLMSNGKRTTPIEVSAAILAKLARDASSYLGLNVRDVVVTVPAHFGDRERSDTKAAAEMAGLRVLQMINEPSAAALTYAAGQQTRPGISLVFDLGGGTFDATVLQQTEREGHVLATQGIEELGGINFTNSLATYLQQRYKAQTGTPYPEDYLSIDRLYIAAENAKCALSTQQITTAHLIPGQGSTAQVEVTRAQFEDLIDLFILQLQNAVELALERAQKMPGEVERVLLCGGSSRIPAIQTMLTDLFGRPPESVIDLDLSVALGAAYQAALCAHRAQGEQPVNAGLQMQPGGLVIDCVSYAVGIAVWNSRGDRLTKLVMLQPGAPLDTWSAPYAVRILNSANDFPPIDIYQGEGTELDPRDRIGEIPLSLPPGTQAGGRAVITMLQDQSGLIQVRLTVNEQEIPGNLRRI